MDREEAIKAANMLAERTEKVMVGSNGADGYPNIKCMFKADAEGLKKIWLSTNTSSRRVAQFRDNPKACIYFVDEEKFMGLMLVGDIEVLQDQESRQRLWREGCEIYYPLGVDDPDYSVLCFTAKWGNYYHGLQNITFQIE